MFSAYSQIYDSNENIIFGDGSKGRIHGVGNISISQEHSISNVLHVDPLSYNLLSVS